MPYTIVLWPIMQELYLRSCCVRRLPHRRSTISGRSGLVGLLATLSSFPPLSTPPCCWMSIATRPVQPVWWLAPSPAPLSPSKYSWKRRYPSRPALPPNRSSWPSHGRRPVALHRNRLIRRRERSSAACPSVRYWPDPVGHSTVHSSP